MVGPIDISPQHNDFIVGLSARDRHHPILVPGSEESVVRAPGPCGHTARMDYVRVQPACLGVPDLDCSILSPGSHPQTVGAISHGPDPGFVPPKNRKLLSGACLPDMHRSVLGTGSELPVIRAPREPPDPPPWDCGGRPSHDQGRSFPIDGPDPDQAIGDALGKSIAGDVPRQSPCSIDDPVLREGSLVLIRKGVEVEPLPSSAVGRLALRRPVGEQFVHV
jgi:hypothetical protein